MNLAQIVVLLQTVLALLGQPGAGQNPEIQAMASRAIQTATEALKQPPVVIPIYQTPIYPPVYETPQPQETPVTDSPVEVPITKDVESPTEVKNPVLIFGECIKPGWTDHPIMIGTQSPDICPRGDYYVPHYQ